MKSRGMDIFRPLAVASSAASIFRRGNNNIGGSNGSGGGGKQRSKPRSRDPPTPRGNRADDDGLVVVVASDSDEGEGEEYRRIGRSTPIVGGASSGGTSGGENRAVHLLSSSLSSSSSNSDECAGSRYYKIQLVPKTWREKNDGSSGQMIATVLVTDENEEEVQLTAGDDSSVQLTPCHNERIRVASDREAQEDVDDDDDDVFVARLATEKYLRGGIALAAPVVSPSSDHDCHHRDDVSYDAAAEQEVDITGVVMHSSPSSYPSTSTSTEEEGGRRRRQQQMQRGRQRWTVTDDGTIVAMPPSPSHVSSMASDFSSHRLSSHILAKNMNARVAESSALSSYSPRPSSPPPELVRSVSACSSTSSSSSPSMDDMRGDAGQRSLASSRRPKTPSPPPPIVTLASVSLESPPRMTRSFDPASLFRDSDTDRTSSYGSDDQNRGSKRKKSRTARPVVGPTSAPRAASPSPSCGDSRYNFLSHVLDAFSLNGFGCCRHSDGDGDVRLMSGGICA
ncbi:hypothetical protein ACHAXA_006105 [Cyclostephanos tholiformis]|uniref:Uncharacterized protein n=1 Tax=Cyclostephanos tholiformis TaxID=382380 RepID=A0ABD3R7B8_9STRA